MEQRERTEYIFGIRAVIEALKAGKVFDKIMIRRDAGGELLKELTDMLKGTDMFVQRVPNEKLNRIRNNFV